MAYLLTWPWPWPWPWPTLALALSPSPEPNQEVHAQVPCTPQPKGWGVRSAQLKKSEGSEGSEVTETVRGQSRGPSRGQSLFHQRARTSLAQGSVSSASSRAISLPRGDGHLPRGGDGRLLPISISPISSATRSKLDGLVGELQRVQPQPPQHSRGGDDAEGDHTTRSSQMQWLMERAEIAEVRYIHICVAQIAEIVRLQLELHPLTTSPYYIPYLHPLTSTPCYTPLQNSAATTP